MPTPDTTTDDVAGTDPVLQRRARIARAVSIGLRVGYALFAIAMVVFFIGLFSRLTDAMVTVILICLGVGSVVLAPAIVFNYGVKAAIRDDREAST